MPSITKQIKLNSDQTGRIDQVLRSILEVSHSRIKGIISHGCVTLNGQGCNDPGELVKEGDALSVKYDPQHNYREIEQKTWNDRAFTIVHEDAHLLVVNKVASVLTVATDYGHESSLEERVSNYLRRTSRHKQAIMIQRLDRGVSGLVVIAKTAKAAEELRFQFAAHKPARIYTAIVKGHMELEMGTFQSYLQTGNNLDQYSTTDKRQGKLAITHYYVEKRLRDTTVLRVELETGRRNQIRVHFAEHGHPVLGDTRYKEKDSRHPLWTANRLALHAQTLEFEHPETGKIMAFSSEIPKAIQRFIAMSR